MAQFETSGLDDLIRDMKEMGELTGETADRMLMAGAEQVKIAWKAAAEKHGHRDTGRMIASIGYPRTPKTVEDVRAIDIYPQGTDPVRKNKDGTHVRNAEKAFILHYGTSSRPGSRWIDDADAMAEPIVQSEMERIWDEHLRERGL